MNTNQYDKDCTTFSPQGRLIQVEYAMETVTHGSIVVGLKSKTHVVLGCLLKAQSELVEPLRKTFKIDDHMSIGIAGLMADARVLTDYMRNECLNHRYVYGSPMNTGRLVQQIADKSQAKTQFASRRPYGVGMLVVSVDDDGPHLYQTLPDGNFFEYNAMAIGNRQQSAKTYLEKHFETFPDCGRDQLIGHALESLEKALENPSTEPLTPQKMSVTVIGIDEACAELTNEQLTAFLAGRATAPSADVEMVDATA